MNSAVKVVEKADCLLLSDSLDVEKDGVTVDKKICYFNSVLVLLGVNDLERGSCGCECLRLCGYGLYVRSKGILYGILCVALIKSLVYESSVVIVFGVLLEKSHNVLHFLCFYFFNSL